MIEFPDTSVLNPVFVARHAHHEPSFRLFHLLKPKAAFCASHTLAEVYATLTALPTQPRISPAAALRTVDVVSERLRPVTLDHADYLAALSTAAEAQIAGGTIYDALIAACARKVGAEVFYTWNLKHFRRLLPELAEQVRTPPWPAKPSD